MLSVTALGRSERVPGRGGAGPGDVLVVTGPLGAAGAAFREQRYVRPPIRLDEGTRAGRDRARDARHLRRARRDAGHIAARSGCRLVIDLERVPLADGRDDRRPRLRRGLRAARGGARARRRFAEIGRCEEGEGVELLLRDGEPVELGGFEHFRQG